MITPGLFLAALTVDKPVAIGIAVAAMAVLYLAFKITRFAVKILLVIAAVTAIGLAARWYFAAH